METKFNFNSSPCTSIEQSKRLLALSLKKETADMYRPPSWGGSKIIGYYAPNVVTFDDHFDENLNDLPAWSLYRLIDMIDDECVIQLSNFSISGKVFVKHNNLYDNIVDCIELLIKEGYFNKEYLV